MRSDWLHDNNVLTLDSIFKSRAIKLEFIYLVIFIFISLEAFAQRDQPGVKVQGRATQSTIKLRWAPNTPATWQLGNTYGYTIERIALSVNNKVIQSPVKIILNSSPIKPAPLDVWEAPADEDDYVAVAAQAIYGETFELTNNYSSDIVQVINKSRELESRFSFALFASDVSVKAAQLSGLYYEDETIAPGTKYLYRIYANIPTHILKVDTGYVYVGLQDYKPLPKPVDFQGDFGDHHVTLSWNGEILRSFYNSYWVERSDDGKNFKSITEQPIVNAFPGDNPKSKMLFKLDSLPQNDKKFYYRVKGIDPFGEISQPSDTISGSGRPAMAYNATIIKAEVNKDGHAEIKWTFPAKAMDMVKSFDLLRMDPRTKQFNEIQKDISKSILFVKDTTPLSSNYYVIRVNDRYGRTTNSFPYLVQMEDSIRPASPVNLRGSIDSLGIVYLTWSGNTENDLSGYSVFRSNFTSNEFIQLPGEIIKQTFYTDTIKLNNLTEKIHYKIRAYDNRFNASEFSSVLTLKKPDKIPPVPPVFSRIKSDSLGINLFWEPSGSEDVVYHALYRKAETEQDWTLMQTFSNTEYPVKSYRDTNVKHRTEYSYTLLAVDDDGLESEPASPLAMTWVSQNPYPKIEQLFYSVDREKKSIKLSWNYNVIGVKKYMIYKSINKGPIRFYKTIEGKEFDFVDLYNQNDNVIEYRVIAAFENGDRTRLSEGVLIRI